MRGNPLGALCSALVVASTAAMGASVTVHCGVDPSVGPGTGCPYQAPLWAVVNCYETGGPAWTYGSDGRLQKQYDWAPGTYSLRLRWTFWGGTEPKGYAYWYDSATFYSITVPATDEDPSTPDTIDVSIGRNPVEMPFDEVVNNWDNIRYRIEMVNPDGSIAASADMPPATSPVTPTQVPFSGTARGYPGGHVRMRMYPIDEAGNATGDATDLGDYEIPPTPGPVPPTSINPNPTLPQSGFKDSVQFPTDDPDADARWQAILDEIRAGILGAGADGGGTGGGLTVGDLGTFTSGSMTGGDADLSGVESGAAGLGTAAGSAVSSAAASGIAQADTLAAGFVTQLRALFTIQPVSLGKVYTLHFNFGNFMGNEMSADVDTSGEGPQMIRTILLYVTYISGLMLALRFAAWIQPGSKGT